jgi:hypothetical protein
MGGVLMPDLMLMSALIKVDVVNQLINLSQAIEVILVGKAVAEGIVPI